MASLDRWEPKLRVTASGLGGSGYRIPTRKGEDGKPLLVPGVTTVLKAIAAPGITQWAVDNTAAYAVANIDGLLSRTEDQGYGMLRWYHKRQPDFDDPEVNVHNYHVGVLDDAAELGSRTHDWISDFVMGYFPEEPRRDEIAQMVTKFLDWWDEHEVEVLATEITVVGNGYAGTLDHIWKVDGVPMLIDAKTSRRVGDSHRAQLSALGAAHSMMVQTTEDDPDGVLYKSTKWGKMWWREGVIPEFTRYAVLHLRPDDWDKDGKFIPAFCELEEISQGEIDAGWKIFNGALQIVHGQSEMKKALKGKG